MNGYGRGYYGGEQLDRQRSGTGWLKLAAVVVGGAAIWYWWPRKRVVLVPMDTLSASTATPPSATELEQIARSRGFSSVKDYEDSVLATTRDLKLTGAKIELPPHLQYLMPRVEAL
jgi:hypothetical protein